MSCSSNSCTCKEIWPEPSVDARLQINLLDSVIRKFVVFGEVRAIRTFPCGRKNHKTIFKRSKSDRVMANKKICLHPTYVVIPLNLDQKINGMHLEPIEKEMEGNTAETLRANLVLDIKLKLEEYGGTWRTYHAEDEVKFEINEIPILGKPYVQKVTATSWLKPKRKYSSLQGGDLGGDVDTAKSGDHIKIEVLVTPCCDHGDFRNPKPPQTENELYKQYIPYDDYIDENDAYTLGKEGCSRTSREFSPQQSAMATKRSVGTLKEAELKGKKVFVRVDLNAFVVKDKIFNDFRVRASVPTIKYLMGHGAKVILCGHLGHPRYFGMKEYSLEPLVPRLSELLGLEVKMANDCIGGEVKKMIDEIPEGGVLLLENVRFYLGEELNDPKFAEMLASLAEIYVNNAFSNAHRAHASTAGIAKYLKPSVAGFLIQKELEYLIGVVAEPKRPFAAIVGSSKISSKIEVIEFLLEKVNVLLLGGSMIYTFYKAQGLSVGSSPFEADELDLATSLLEKAKSKGVYLLLPTDVVIADKFASDANTQIVAASNIPDGAIGLDIGPESIKAFSEALDTAQTIIWTGRMCVFEFDREALIWCVHECVFDCERSFIGTKAIAKKLGELNGKGVTSIVVGSDAARAVAMAGVADKMSHVSTGGIAAFELLKGKPLLAVLALDDAPDEMLVD